MSRPQPRQQAAARAAAAMSGAVDLSVLKERADAQRAQPNRPTQPPGPPSAPPASGPPATGAAFPAVYDVTEADFEADVVARSDQVLVLVDLWATWCGPCKQLSPTLEALARQSGGKWVLAKVDVDANPRIAQLFGVQSIPTVVAIAGGQPVSAFAGAQPAAQIQGWVDDILAKYGHTFTGVPTDGEPEPEPVDPRMAAAEDKLNNGDIDGALADYKEIAAAEPGNVEAVSLVRNLEFVSRAQGHDPALLTDVAADDVDGQLAAADVELLNQQPEAAFDRIIKVIARTAGDERTTARTRLLELFELFDPAEPFVVAARRKLATALY